MSGERRVSVSTHCGIAPGEGARGFSSSTAQLQLTPPCVNPSTAVPTIVPGEVGKHVFVKASGWRAAEERTAPVQGAAQVEAVLGARLGKQRAVPDSAKPLRLRAVNPPPHNEPRGASG